MVFENKVISSSILLKIAFYFEIISKTEVSTHKFDIEFTRKFIYSKSFFIPREFVIELHGPFIVERIAFITIKFASAAKMQRVANVH